MKNTNRAYTSFSQTRPQHVSDLPSPKENITQDDINDIKLKTQQMELEKRQLRSKTNRMKSVIKDRNQSLKGVEKQTSDKQSIKTATKNTLLSLESTVKQLENSLAARKQELDELKKSDKLAVSEELQIEIQMLYLEQKRLIQESQSMKENESIIMGELNRLRRQAASTKSNEESIDRLQIEIDQLTEKLFAYGKSEMRVAATKKLKMIHDNPSVLEQVRAQLEEEISKNEKIIEDNKKALEKVQKKEERNIEYLQSVIDEQAQKIQEALDELEKGQKEDKRPSSPASQNSEEKQEKDSDDEKI